MYNGRCLLSCSWHFEYRGSQNSSTPLKIQINNQQVVYQLSMIDLVFEQQVGRYLVLHETHFAVGSLQHSG